MAIQRDNSNSDKGFSASLNIVLTGSKKMPPAQQEAAMTVGRVRILVADADDPENVLIDAQVPAKEFKTGSVGYGLQQRGLHFTRDR